jgi:hypothetical protein
MRFRLDATEEELYEKGERLVEALSRSLAYAHPGLSEALEKALPEKDTDLKYSVLRGMKAEARAEYEATLKRMLADIWEILDSSSALQKAGPYVGPKGGLWADPQHTQHWEPSKPGAMEAFATQFGGKVVPHFNDPSKVVVKVHPSNAQALLELKTLNHLSDPIITGGKYVMLSVPKNLSPAPKPKLVQAIQKLEGEKVSAPGKPAVSYAAQGSSWKPHSTVAEAQAWAKSWGVDVAYKDLKTANETNQALSEQHPLILKHHTKAKHGEAIFQPLPPETLAKSEEPEPAEHAFHDYTQPVVEADERMYRRVKKLAIRRGYLESDFDEGGPLYGWSTNELLNLLHTDARDRGE